MTAEPGLPYDEWEVQLYAYDEALVTAADVLEVPVPPGARDAMGPAQRTAIEAGLADAGFDIWSEE